MSTGFPDENATITVLYMPADYMKKVGKELKRISKENQIGNKRVPKVSEKLREKLKKIDRAKGRRMIFGR